MGKFIKLVGVEHHHDVPLVLGYGQLMGRKHRGSTWECECGVVLTWNGKKWTL
jgi:hypothetical protein